MASPCDVYVHPGCRMVIIIIIMCSGIRRAVDVRFMHVKRTVAEMPMLSLHNFGAIRRVRVTKMADVDVVVGLI